MEVEVEAEVEASEAVVEGAGGTDPSSLQKSLMHSWMPTMPKYVFILPEAICTLIFFLFLIRFFSFLADGHQLEDIRNIDAAVCFLYFM